MERSDYTALRVGESLPPPAQLLLNKLGVWDTFLSRGPLESSGTRAAWGSADFHENEFIFSPFGRGWHLDRRDFDAMLADEVERVGVSVYRNTVAEPVGYGDRWTMRLHPVGDESNSREMSARFIVDATGRRSSFARSQGAKHQVFDHLVGIVVFLRFAHEDCNPDTYTSVEACENGWWYTAGLPNSDMAAIFMTDAGSLPSLRWRTLDQWRALARNSPHTVKRIEAGVPLGDPKLHLASSQRLESFYGTNWLAVGDAACTWDPLSSQGVMKGLQSGIDASLAICRHLRGDVDGLAAYGRRIAQGYSRYLDGRAAYYSLEQRWPTADFWRSRQEIITLHPEERLCTTSTSEGDGRFKFSTRLTNEELKVLSDACVRPSPAHEVLAAFKMRTSPERSDREILLAMQAMVAGGILTRC